MSQDILEQSGWLKLERLPAEPYEPTEGEKPRVYRLHLNEFDVCQDFEDEGLARQRFQSELKLQSSGSGGFPGGTAVARLEG